MTSQDRSTVEADSIYSRTADSSVTEFYSLAQSMPPGVAATSSPISPFSRTAAAVENDVHPRAPRIPNGSYHNHSFSQDLLDRRGSMISSVATSVNMDMSNPNHANDLPALITPGDFQNTLGSYQKTLESAERYRQALLAVSSAAADFGAALEECSKCKGAGTSSDGLLAAGGLHYLVSNHEQILAESIQRSFEEPVKKQLDVLKTTAAENERQFKGQIRSKSKQLKSQEKANQKLARTRGIRNLGEYRHSLQELTAKIDDIDQLKHQYFESAFSLAQNTSSKILGYASSVVRAEVEIYEGIARKGWSGGGLDGLISTCPDPFAKDEDEGEDQEDGLHKDEDNTDQGHLFGINTVKPQVETEIFTVLPDRSILPEDIGNDTDDTEEEQEEEEGGGGGGGGGEERGHSQNDKNSRENEENEQPGEMEECFPEITPSDSRSTIRPKTSSTIE